MTNGNLRFGSTCMRSHGCGAAPTPSPHAAATDGNTVPWLTPGVQVAALEASQQSWPGTKLTEPTLIVPPPVAGHALSPSAAPPEQAINAPVGTPPREVAWSFWSPNAP